MGIVTAFNFQHFNSSNKGHFVSENLTIMISSSNSVKYSLFAIKLYETFFYAASNLILLQMLFHLDTRDIYIKFCLFFILFWIILQKNITYLFLACNGLKFILNWAIVILIKYLPLNMSNQNYLQIIILLK